MSKEIKWQELVLQLKDQGVNKIQVMYSGSGDSGGIDETHFYDKNEDALNNKELEDLIDTVNDAVYPLLDGIEDWYNNDGGDGIVTIDLQTLKYEIENNVNFMEQETYHHKGSIKKLVKETQ
jgi:hypothetical protein